MATDRTRNRDQLLYTGYGARKFPGSSSVSTDSRSAINKNKCVDVIGNPKGNNYLDIDHQIKSGIVPLNGIQVIAPDGYNLFSNYPGEFMSGTLISHNSLPWNTEAIDATSAMARTNPNRPVVNLPVFLWELRELPSLIKNKGDTILHRLADANLNWQFGWRPLIGDLLSLLNFQSAFDKRAAELRRMYNRGGLRRNVQLGTFTRGSQSQLTETSWPGGVVCKRNSTTVGKRWASVRWKPASLPPASNAQLNRAARNAVLGLQFEAATLWEALPWSWLVDWFTSAGDFLEAHRNTIPVTMDGACVMTQTTTTEHYVVVSRPSWAKGGGGVLRRITKHRNTFNSPQLVANLPFLSGRQLSILGSLAVLKFR